MTEAEWLMCVEPAIMLAVLRGNVSQRKLRLFAVACCHVFNSTDERSRQALQFAERFADGFATHGQRQEMYFSLRACSDYAPESVTSVIHGHAFVAASRAAEWSSIEVGAAADYESRAPDRLPDIVRARETERRRQALLLRDIFGNPFRPVAFDPAWRTTDVMLLAQGIYDAKAFDRMPILADALQDAGCASADILDHCRDTALAHVRGCWVVDAVLGKS